MENVIQVRNEYRKQQWAQIIRECQDSGLSNREYCRQQGISEKSYYYWLRKLRNAAAERLPQIVEMEAPAGTEQKHHLLKRIHLKLALHDPRQSVYPSADPCIRRLCTPDNCS